MKKNQILTTAILLAGFPLSAQEQKSEYTKPATDYSKKTNSYKAKDYTYLIGMPGFSENALKTHFKLYQGYVSNTNKLLSLLNEFSDEGMDRTPQYAEIKRRLMWEFDGMRLHEYYFENLGGDGSFLSKDDPFYKQLSQQFGSFEQWKADFIATGAIRGIGWAVLYRDPLTGKLINTWVNEHDHGHMTYGGPILIMDVFEHAYMLDYGLDRMKYIEAFFNNINWKTVSGRSQRLNRGQGVDGIP